MIVLSSATGALVVVAAMVISELLHAPRSEMARILLASLPAFAVAAVAVYGLCAILISTATLVTALLRLRHGLGRTAADQPAAQTEAWREWGAGFASTFRRLAVALSRSDDAEPESRLAANGARSEIARLHYISLARSHFLSALIVLAGIVGLGLAQDYGPLRVQTGAIPTASAVLIMAGLVLLALLGRIAVDVTAEPLLEAIPYQPAERVEISLLRRAVELLEAAGSRPWAADRSAVSAMQIPEQLVASIERNHDALLHAVNRLSSNTEALEAAMRSSAETMETTLRETTARQRPIDEEPTTGGPGFRDLQAAVGDLTEVLRKLSAAPEGGQDAPLAGDAVARSTAASKPQLARELKKLLQEIEAAL